MKQIIPIHSIIDITTNSSSELFVCNTQKTEDEVRDFLEALGQVIGEHHGMGEIRSANGVDDLLKEIHEVGIYYWSEGFFAQLIGLFVPWDADLKPTRTPYWRDEDLDPPFERMNVRDMTDRERDNYWKELSETRNRLAEEQWQKIDQWFEENRSILEKYIGHFICAESEDDNSVPYDLFNVIETRLHGVRLHLG